MKSKIIVGFADQEKLTAKDIEDRLFWAVFEAKKKFGVFRVDKEIDFVFDRPTKEVTFTNDGEINNFISNYILKRNPDGTEWGE